VVFKRDAAPKRKRKSPTLSPEVRKRSGDILRALWTDPEWRAKRKAASVAYNKKRMSNPEYKEKELKRLRSYEQKRLAKVRLAMAEKAKDPEYIASLSERTKAKWAAGEYQNRKQHRTPQGQAKVNAAVKRSHDRRRGFSIPPHLRRDYDNLIQIKKYKAREAGIILGIIKVAPKQSIMTLEEYKVPKGELGEILQAVSTVTGIPCEDIGGLSRKTRIMRARLVFYYVAKTYCRHSYPKIGEAIGRDHATVHSGCATVRDNSEAFSPTIRRVLDLLSRDEKIAA
jgi:hypothetical protein